MRALARRDRSPEELRALLERAGVGHEGRDEVLRRLAAAGYLDEGRFAGERARVLAERGYGDAFVRADLEQRGVAVASMTDAIAALEPEAERAVAFAARLGGGLRAARALARKGFAEEALEAALGEAVAPEARPGIR